MREFLLKIFAGIWFRIYGSNILYKNKMPVPHTYGWPGICNQAQSRAGKSQ